MNAARARRAGAGDTAPASGADEERDGTGLTLADLQRARILSALRIVLGADGAEAATVTRIVSVARIPRAAFYQHFGGRDDALRTVVEHAAQRSREAVAEASALETGWTRKVRAGVLALLELYESEPELGRLCLIHSHHPEPGMQQLRRQLLSELAGAIAAGEARGRPVQGALAAECTATGVLGLLEARLGEQRRPRLVELTGELTSFVVLPYRGVARAGVERRRPNKTRVVRAPVEEQMNGGVTNPRMTYRTLRVLAAIASCPGLSNAGVAEQAGISDQGQISKLLKRLHAIGLVANTGGGQELGASNEWRLTAEGRRLERSVLDHHLPARR